MLNLTKTKRIAYSGLLTALAAALAALSIPLYMFGGLIKSIGFGVVPVMLSGLLLGPLNGFCVGAAADVVAYILFPKGAYFPGFTLTYGLIGLLPALILRKQIKSGNINFRMLLLAVSATHFICSFCLNTFFLVHFLGYSAAIMLPRAAAQLIMIPVYALVLNVILKLPYKNKS